MLDIRLTALLWVISFTVCAFTFASLNAVFFLSFAVFAAVSVYVERHQRDYERDLKYFRDDSDRLI